MKIIHVVGARPNFMKIAPIIRQMAATPQVFDQLLVHTGQHYDTNMSKVFFDELDIPRPDINLGVGSGSHAQQTAHVMLGFEPILIEKIPDWVFVVGDVNSTLACALVCSKLGIPVAHVEAGLRSFDRNMPEEINRQLTDQIADVLFTHSPEADENLKREGISPEKIHFVGNVMIDNLVYLLPRAQARWKKLATQHHLERYILVTLHRPSNVDDPKILKGLISALDEISREIPVFFPVHPRTRKGITSGNIQISSQTLRLVEPVGYLDFLALQAHAELVITDSGGVQEETTYLRVPCLTVRPNTERPVTINCGTNELVHNEPEHLIDAITRRLGEKESRYQQLPALWDGKAASRIVQAIIEIG